MQVVDDEGRLFGVANVIDVLVVLVVVAVVGAGLALVLAEDGVDQRSPTPDGDETGVGYATLAFEASDDVAATVSAGTNMSLGNGTVTVTDVFRTPLHQRSADDEGSAQPTTRDALVVTRVRYRGQPPTTVAGKLRAGDSVTVASGSARVGADVLAFDESRQETLPAGPTDLVLGATVPIEKADAIRTGDRIRVADRAVGTVQSVTDYPVERSDRRRLLLGLRIQTIKSGSDRSFGGETVLVGRTLTVHTGNVSLTGRISDRGRTDPGGRQVDATIDVVWENVRPSQAAALSDGLAEHHRGATATVRSVTASPASTLVTTDDGRVLERPHPTNRDVRLTLDATARSVNGDLRFHGRPLQLGANVTLDFEPVRVQGIVVGVQPN